MKHRIALLLLAVLSLGLSAFAKERVIVLTDILNEPDDTQSMVRFMTRYQRVIVTIYPA